MQDESGILEQQRKKSELFNSSGRTGIMKERGKIMTEEQKTEGCSESACSSCSQAGSCSSKKVDLHEPANAHSSIGKVIGVVSGKGGVGKSLVTGSLARQMVKMGYKVGILDADITGPSIPKMYGIHEKAQGTQEGNQCGYI